MNHIRDLGYTWIHYGQELYSHSKFKCSDGYEIRYTDHRPQGTTLKATKLDTDVWLIDSKTQYVEEDEDDYFCWFLAVVDHDGHHILYQWIKGDIHPHSWTFRGNAKNAAIDFDDGKQIIAIHHLIVRAKELAGHMRLTTSSSHN